MAYDGDIDVKKKGGEPIGDMSEPSDTSEFECEPIASDCEDPDDLEGSYGSSAGSDDDDPQDEEPAAELAIEKPSSGEPPRFDIGLKAWDIAKIPRAICFQRGARIDRDVVRLTFRKKASRQMSVRGMFIMLVPPRSTP